MKGFSDERARSEKFGVLHMAVTGVCEEETQLRRCFLGAIHELNELQSQQVRAVIDGDAEFSRFDVLIHAAQEAKDNSKYAWMSHVETHRCGER